MLVINNYIDLLAIITLVACLHFAAFALLRCFTRYQILDNQAEYVFFAILSICVAFWAFTPLFQHLPPRLETIKVSSFLLVAFSMSLYLSCLFRNQLTDFPVTAYITTVIAVVAFSYLLLLIRGSNLPTYFIISFLVLVIFLLNIYILFKIARSKQENLYFILLIVSGLFTVLFLYDSVSALIFKQEVPYSSLIGGLLFVITIGFKTLDYEYLTATQDLNSQLAAVKEVYQAEVENIEDVVISLARTIDAKDKYTEGHTERVSQYAVFLGERLGLDDKRLDNLRIGALVHDLGKIGINLNILNKIELLTEEEKAQIRLHPELGEQICRPLKAFENIRDIIRHHHEKLDGSGYPDGLKGEEISLDVRIVAIADIFDALTTERSYRKALHPDQAITILKEEALDGKLDGKIVEQFEEMLIDMGLLT